MKINRLLTNLACRNLSQSTQFYTSLFDLRVNYESDWFIQLVASDSPFELGLINPDNTAAQTVFPAQARGAVSGAYLTFVVDSADVLHQQAKQLGFTILQPPEMTFYGQKRLLLQAPEGTICDVSSLE